MDLFGFNIGCSDRTIGCSCAALIAVVVSVVGVFVLITVVIHDGDFAYVIETITAPSDDEGEDDKVIGDDEERVGDDEERVGDDGALLEVDADDDDDRREVNRLLDAVTGPFYKKRAETHLSLYRAWLEHPDRREAIELLDGDADPDDPELAVITADYEGTEDEVPDVASTFEELLSEHKGGDLSAGIAHRKRTYPALVYVRAVEEVAERVEVDDQSSKEFLDAFEEEYDEVESSINESLKSCRDFARESNGDDEAEPPEKCRQIERLRHDTGTAALGLVSENSVLIGSGLSRDDRDLLRRSMQNPDIFSPLTELRDESDLERFQAKLIYAPYKKHYEKILDENEQ